MFSPDSSSKARACAAVPMAACRAHLLQAHRPLALAGPGALHPSARTLHAPRSVRRSRSPCPPHPRSEPGGAPSRGVEGGGTAAARVLLRWRVRPLRSQIESRPCRTAGFPTQNPGPRLQSPGVSAVAFSCHVRRFPLCRRFSVNPPFHRVTESTLDFFFLLF